MLAVNILDIQTKFNELLSSVIRGDNVILTYHGKPIAKLETFAHKNTRLLGFVEGSLPDSFFDPLPESEIQAWGL